MSEGTIHWMSVFINWVPVLFWLWLAVNAFFHSTRVWKTMLVPTALFALMAVAEWFVGDKDEVLLPTLLAVCFMVIARYQRKAEKILKQTE